MNNLEKRSFYSFLALYLGSSLFFLMLSGYWYFTAQKSALENTTYYKLQHLADSISGLIIHAQMSGTPLILPKIEEHYEYMLIKSEEKRSFEKNYFEENAYKILVSSAPQKHLDIEYVVIKTDVYHHELQKLQKNILLTSIAIFLAIVLISWILSKLFMRPIHEKVRQIEQFIQDISHELNTPITALQMSAKRAMQKGVYDAKILTNISISTKQLYSIYQSLAYLSFNIPQQEAKPVSLKPVLDSAIEYYRELSHAKNIIIRATVADVTLTIIETKAELLFSNLISNAIKYSMPNTTIGIILREGYFSIEDEGVGIAKEKLEEIFKLYKRGSSLAGGFGIGLSIVKQICDEFHIKVDVRSELDHGSCFTLTWSSNH
ncbi:MAG: HAMP domain-containing sensor histidine kinase [Sulfurimonas sp.]|nr:HAMP domain-containing sensor histidine kinase [Sulfurimonas sp.]